MTSICEPQRQATGPEAVSGAIRTHFVNFRSAQQRKLAGEGRDEEESNCSLLKYLKMHRLENIR